MKRVADREEVTQAHEINRLGDENPKFRSKGFQTLLFRVPTESGPIRTISNSEMPSSLATA